MSLRNFAMFTDGKACEMLKVLELCIQGGPKKCPNMFLSEVHQISTKFDDFQHTDSQDDRIV